MGDPAMTPERPESLDLEVGGQHFTLYVHPGPSGLRGQVFDGEEKVAGVQIYHSTDVARLVALARQDLAVLRAVERHATKPAAPG